LLQGNSAQSASAGQKPVGVLDAIWDALHHPSYLMLAAGFFVCGFHVAFLATHLPGVIAGAVWRLVAGHAGVVQYRGQHRHGLGGWTLAHEVAAVTGLCHGGFFGAWLGGWVFEATGNYNWIWYADIVLALGAALIHMLIREARVITDKKRADLATSP
jgi:hypothetical protein